MRLIITVPVMYMQEISELFNYINSSLLRGYGDGSLDVLIECDFVELVQKIWRQYFRPERLEEFKKDLPVFINTSLSVMHISHFVL